jgi:hypothetical protein
VSQYTVVWLRDAIDELAEIWLAATDRNAVTQASAEIDRALLVNAATKGKPLSEGLRIFDASPLRAVFWVNESDRRVEIARVRWF